MFDVSLSNKDTLVHSENEIMYEYFNCNCISNYLLNLIVSLTDNSNIVFFLF